MSDATPHLALVHAWQERRLGRTVVRTYRTTVDLYDVIPNANQPRIGHKEDPELQLQIEANEGIFEPLLLEPHPTYADKYQIIVFVHSRKETARTAKVIRDMALAKDEMHKFLP